MKDGRTYGHNCRRYSCAVKSLLDRKDEGSHEGGVSQQILCFFCQIHEGIKPFLEVIHHAYITLLVHATREK